MTTRTWTQVSAAERDDECQRAVVANGQVRLGPLHRQRRLDIGTDLESPMSLDYFDKAPFAFNGSRWRRYTGFSSADADRNTTD